MAGVLKGRKMSPLEASLIKGSPLEDSLTKVGGTLGQLPLTASRKLLDELVMVDTPDTSQDNENEDTLVSDSSSEVEADLRKENKTD